VCNAVTITQAVQVLEGANRAVPPRFAQIWGLTGQVPAIITGMFIVKTARAAADISDLGVVCAALTDAIVGGCSILTAGNAQLSPMAVQSISVHA
jgi:hypothetical protein